VQKFSRSNDGKTATILGAVVAGLLVLGALLLLSVRLLVDPNHYKPKLIAAVKAATGRDLMLQGDITLSVFPWIALEVGAASLGNPPGFGAAPFVSFRHASFRARLLPLLAERLEVGRIAIDGLDARLERNADGTGNWEGFGRSLGAGPAGAAPRTGGAPGAGDAAGAGGRAFESLAGLTLHDARVSYHGYVLEHLELDVGSVAGKSLVPVTVRFEANRGVAGEHASADINLNVRGDLDARTFEVAALTFHGLASLAGNPRPVRWDFTAAALDLDLAAQTLVAPAFALDVAGALLSGTLKGEHLKDAPHFTGSLALAPLVVREYLPRLGLTALHTHDPRALSLASAACTFSYGADRAALEDLKVTVDETHLTGHAALVEAPTRALQFALAVDRLDLDRYLPPAGGPDAPPAPPVPVAAGVRQSGTGADASAAPTTLPLEVNGSLKVGAVNVAPLDLTAVRITVAASGGVVHLFPLQAQVDGGEYSGNIVFDRRGPLPVLTLDEHLTGVDLGRFGAAGAKNRLTGEGSLTLTATGRGAASAALLDTLNGRLEAVVNHGALEGVDVGYQLARAETLFNHEASPGAAAPGAAAPGAKDTHRTPFDAMSLTAQITNGVAQTHDLTIASPVFKVTGAGSVDLRTQVIDLSLLADTLRTARNAPVQIPIKVTGPVADPAVRPDLDAFLRSQLGQKVRELVKDKLKGLFER
jgi:AsmA protein